MIFIGDKSDLDSIIFNNIQSGFYNGKVVPCLIYDGKYIKEVNKDHEFEKIGLNEIIDEIIPVRDYETGKIYRNFFITRQIGTDNPNSGKPLDMPQTRISMIYNDGENLRVWTPTNKEIIQDLKFLCGHAGKGYMTVFKELNNMLSTRMDFSMQDLVNNMSDPPRGFKIGGMIRGSFGDQITPISALFSLIKNIMISEDMRFASEHHLGRYKFQIAILDHVLNNKSINEVL